MHLLSPTRRGAAAVRRPGDALQTWRSASPRATWTGSRRTTTASGTWPATGCWRASANPW